jgi:hypothetical protein
VWRVVRSCRCGIEARGICGRARGERAGTGLRSGGRGVVPALPCRWLPARYAHHKRPSLRGPFKPSPMQPRKKAPLEYEALFSFLKLKGCARCAPLRTKAFTRDKKEASLDGLKARPSLTVICYMLRRSYVVDFIECISPSIHRSVHRSLHWSLHRERAKYTGLGLPVTGQKYTALTWAEAGLRLSAAAHQCPRRLD